VLVLLLMLLIEIPWQQTPSAERRTSNVQLHRGGIEPEMVDVLLA
jgi:hypothetical protein